MPSNRSRAFAFRDSCLLAFHSYGFHGAAQAPQSSHPHGDITGIPAWTVATRAQQGLDLATALAEVQAEARAEGNDRFVSIQAKRGYPTDEAYAVMPLRVWFDVVAELQSGATAKSGSEPSPLAV